MSARTERAPQAFSNKILQQGESTFILFHLFIFYASFALTTAGLQHVIAKSCNFLQFA